MNDIVDRKLIATACVLIMVTKSVEITHTKCVDPLFGCFDAHQFQGLAFCLPKPGSRYIFRFSVIHSYLTTKRIIFIDPAYTADIWLANLS